MKKNQKYQSGFTLIEVLIALVILAIAMTTLIISSGELTHNNSRLEDESIASWVAANAIAKARLGLVSPGAGENSLNGQEEMFHQQWKWTMSRTNTNDKNTSSLKVTVSPMNGEPVIQMMGYLRN